ncbi:hypothetical protein [Achromobacter kerstersii]|uniref:hypothetical protein n=1 Tax=Achromobacter kerstersii TaxID=1353890 RepID=UPI003D0637D0
MIKTSQYWRQINGLHPNFRANPSIAIFARLSAGWRAASQRVAISSIPKKTKPDIDLPQHASKSPALRACLCLRITGAKPHEVYGYFQIENRK